VFRAGLVWQKLVASNSTANLRNLSTSTRVAPGPTAVPPRGHVGEVELGPTSRQSPSPRPAPSHVNDWPDHGREPETCGELDDASSVGWRGLGGRSARLRDSEAPSRAAPRSRLRIPLARSNFESGETRGVPPKRIPERPPFPAVRSASLKRRSGPTELETRPRHVAPPARKSLRFWFSNHRHHHTSFEGEPAWKYKSRVAVSLVVDTVPPRVLQFDHHRLSNPSSRRREGGVASAVIELDGPGPMRFRPLPKITNLVAARFGFFASLRKSGYRYELSEIRR